MIHLHPLIFGSGNIPRRKMKALFEALDPPIRPKVMALIFRLLTGLISQVEVFWACEYSATLLCHTPVRISLTPLCMAYHHGRRPVLYSMTSGVNGTSRMMDLCQTALNAFGTLRRRREKSYGKGPANHTLLYLLLHRLPRASGGPLLSCEWVDRPGRLLLLQCKRQSNTTQLEVGLFN